MVTVLIAGIIIGVYCSVQAGYQWHLPCFPTVDRSSMVAVVMFESIYYIFVGPFHKQSCRAPLRSVPTNWTEDAKIFWTGSRTFHRGQRLNGANRVSWFFGSMCSVMFSLKGTHALSWRLSYTWRALIGVWLQGPSGMNSVDFSWLSWILRFLGSTCALGIKGKAYSTHFFGLSLERIRNWKLQAFGISFCGFDAQRKIIFFYRSPGLAHFTAVWQLFTPLTTRRRYLRRYLSTIHQIYKTWSTSNHGGPLKRTQMRTTCV